MAGINDRGNNAYLSALDRLNMPAEPEHELNVVRIQLVPDVPLYSDKPITSVQDAIDLIADDLSTYDREAFAVLNLNTAGMPVSFNMVSMGTLTESIVDPREVFKPSVLSNTNRVILFHNHPSGNATPSQLDLDTTERLIRAGAILGIDVLDHIIVTKDTATSLIQEGAIDPHTIIRETRRQIERRVAENTDAAVYEAESTKETSNKKMSFREKVADAFIKSLEEDPREWTKNWASNETGSPVNMTTGREYRGLNKLYLKFMEQAHGWKDPRWLTFKQAVDAGYKIPKGTKMTSVEYFFMYDNLTKKTIPWGKYNALSDKEKSQKVNTVSGELAQPGEMGSAIKERFSLRHRDHWVYNAAQLEGVPEYEFDRYVNDIEPSAVVSAISDAMQVDIEYREQDRAAYNPLLDRIVMPLPSQFYSEYDYQSTALHELGHATGHESRLNRDIANLFGTPEYAYEELIAEITSCFMGEYVDQPMNDADMGNHMAYVQNWLEKIKEDKNYLFRAIKEAEKAADYMISAGELEKLKEAVIEKNSVKEQTVQTLPEQKEASTTGQIRQELVSTAMGAAKKIGVETDSYGYMNDLYINPHITIGRYGMIGQFYVSYDDKVAAEFDELETALKVAKEIDGVEKAANVELLEGTRLQQVIESVSITASASSSVAEETVQYGIEGATEDKEKAQDLDSFAGLQLPGKLSQDVGLKEIIDENENLVNDQDTTSDINISEQRLERIKEELASVAENLSGDLKLLAAGSYSKYEADSYLTVVLVQRTWDQSYITWLYNDYTGMQAGHYYGSGPDQRDIAELDYYNRMQPDMRPQYRINVYNARYELDGDVPYVAECDSNVPVHYSQLDYLDDEIIMSEADSSETIAYYHSEDDGLARLSDYEMSGKTNLRVDYIRGYPEAFFSMAVLEKLEYDDEGDIATTEICGSTSKPMQIDPSGRNMEILPGGSREYNVEFQSRNGLSAGSININYEAVKYIEGFKGFLKDTIAEGLDRGDITGNGTNAADYVRRAMGEYLNGAPAVIDRNLPRGMELSNDEISAARSFFRNEITSHYGLDKDDTLSRECLRDELARRGLSYSENRDSITQSVQNKLQEAVVDRLSAARTNRLSFGEEI